MPCIGYIMAAADDDIDEEETKTGHCLYKKANSGAEDEWRKGLRSIVLSSRS